MIQVFCFIWIYLTIINPTVTTLYQIRDMLITHFLPDREDKIPFSSIDILQNSIEDCLDNIEKIYKDSFQNFYFSDSLHPVIFNIYWLNGSVTQSANIELTQSFFHHILSFDLTSKFMLMIEEGEVIGCTQWTFVFSIISKQGSYLFYLEPKLTRSNCPSTIFSDSPKTKLFNLNSKIKNSFNSIKNEKVQLNNEGNIHSEENLNNQENINDQEYINDQENMNDQKIINKGGLGGKDNINGKVQRDLIENKKYYFDYETKPDGINFFNRSKDTIFINQNNRFTKSVKASVIPKFKREDLSFYQKLLKHGTFLLEISILDFFAILFSLFKAFALHMKLMQTSSQYEDLSPYEQFHSTIGFWQPLSVITEIFVICSASLLISDSQTFTQYISLNTQLVFGFSAFLSISTAAQWLHFLPSCYCLVLIIRHAFGKLINVMVGIAPIVISIALVAVFLFGFVGEITESMVKLLESILSVTFGDMISDFYLAFTDGSYIYNILSFIFVSICTATAMWLFFTSFTAQMTSIYLEKVSHIIMGDKNREDDE